MYNNRLIKVLISSLMAVMMMLSVSVGTVEAYTTTLPKILDPSRNPSNWYNAPRANFTMSSNGKTATYSRSNNYGDQTPGNSSKWGGLGRANYEFTVTSGDIVTLESLATNPRSNLGNNNRITNYDFQVRYYDSSGNRIDSSAVKINSSNGRFYAVPPRKYNEVTYAAVYHSVTGDKNHKVTYLGKDAKMQSISLNGNTNSDNFYSTFTGFPGLSTVYAYGWPFSTMMIKIMPKTTPTPTPKPQPKPTPTPTPNKRYVLNYKVAIYDENNNELSSPSTTISYKVGGYSSFQTARANDWGKVVGLTSKPTNFSVNVPSGFYEYRTHRVTEIGNETSVLFYLKKKKPAPQNKYKLYQNVRLLDENNNKISSPRIGAKYKTGYSLASAILKPNEWVLIDDLSQRPTGFSVVVPEGFYEYRQMEQEVEGNTTYVWYFLKKEKKVTEDLEVVSIEDANVRVGSPHEVSVVVRNNGKNTQNTKLSLGLVDVADFEALGNYSVNVSNFKPNETRTLKVKIPSIPKAKGKVISTVATINPGNAIKETTYENNRKIGKLNIVEDQEDLEVVSVGKGEANVGDNYRIPVVVKNNGKKVQSNTVEVSLMEWDGYESPKYSIQVNSLKPNETRTVYLDYKVPGNTKGLLYINANINPKKTLEEKTYANNTKFGSLKINKPLANEEDLEVISVGKGEANEGELYKIPIMIRNNGKKAQSNTVEVMLYEWDGYVSPKYNIQVNNLNPNENTTIYLDYKVPRNTRGDLIIRAEINPKKTLEEINYNNNMKFGNLKINKAVDLEVVSIENVRVRSGETVNIPTVIRNNSKTSVTTDVVTSIGLFGKETKKVTLSPLESKTIEVPFTAPIIDPGKELPINSTSEINPGKTIKESDYTNNLKTGKITVFNDKPVEDLEVVSVGTAKGYNGDSCKVPIIVRNNGKNIQNSEVEILTYEFGVGTSEKQTVSVVNLKPGESRQIDYSYKIPEDKKDMVFINANINPKRTIKETTYTNNSKTGVVNILKNDLEVVTVGNKTVGSGTSTNIPVTVRNNGDKPLTSIVRVNINNEDKEVPVTLKPKEEKVIEVPFTAPKIPVGTEKTLISTGEINPNKTIPESNYTNNVKTGKVTVTNEEVLEEDLEVVSIEKIEGYPGETKRIPIVVKNNGKKIQDSEVELSILEWGGGGSKHNIPVADFKPNETRTVYLDYKLPDYKNSLAYTKAVINPKRTIKETTYANNSKESTITILRNDLEVVTIGNKRVESGKSINIPVTVRNNGNKKITSKLVVNVEGSDKDIPVTLDPKEEKVVEVPFTAPIIPIETEKTLISIGVINPDKTIPESNYSNNSKRGRIVVFRESLVPNFSCSDTIEWVETGERDVSYTYTDTDGTKKTGTRKEYSDFKYQAKLNATLTIKDDRELQSSSDYVRLKSGYGFKTVVDTDVVVTQVSGAWTRPHTKVVKAPDKAIAKLSWEVTKILSQPKEVPLIVGTNNGLATQFVNRVNPASATGAKVIYTFIDLPGNKENPVKHPFSVYVSGGGIDSQEFCISLNGAIEIFGNMYEDYHVS